MAADDVERVSVDREDLVLVNRVESDIKPEALFVGAGAEEMTCVAEGYREVRFLTATRRRAELLRTWRRRDIDVDDGSQKLCPSR